MTANISKISPKEKLSFHNNANIGPHSCVYETEVCFGTRGGQGLPRHVRLGQWRPRNWRRGQPECRTSVTEE